jgi:hypothetical protein
MPVAAYRSQHTVNETSIPGLSDDLAAMYRTILYPTSLSAAAVMNGSSRVPVQLIGHHLQQADVAPASVGDASSPSPQLLLWYFLGLAAVQPVVLWLQAAALAVVLNVLRHMPEVQLQFLMSCCGMGGGTSAAAPGSGTSAASTADARLTYSSTGLGLGEAVQEWQDHRQPQQPSQLLSSAGRGRWTWLDWLQFRFLKHSLDIVLVSVCRSKLGHVQQLLH